MNQRYKKPKKKGKREKIFKFFFLVREHAGKSSRGKKEKKKTASYGIKRAAKINQVYENLE